MMKKILVAVIMFAMILSMITFADETNNIRVILNGEEVNFGDVQPLIIDDRTMIPLRSVFEEIGGQVEFFELPTWGMVDGQFVTGMTQNVFITALGNRIRLKIGSNIATVNWDENVEIDVPPVIINDRTLIPLRFIAESIGAYVGWDAATSTVIIDTPEPDFSPLLYYEFPAVPNFQQIFGWPHITSPPSPWDDDGYRFEYFVSNRVSFELIVAYEALLEEAGFARMNVPTGTWYFTDGDLTVGVGWDRDFVSIAIYIGILFEGVDFGDWKYDDCDDWDFEY